MAYWLVKSDPKAYSWEDMKKDKSTAWDGVRNYQARNNLAKMEKNDRALFYHSQQDREVVGITKVTKESFPDPTTNDKRWIAVELTYEKSLNKTVTLNMIKKEPKLKNIALIRQARLSVMPLTKEEYTTIIKMSK